MPDCLRALVRHDYWQQARRSAVTAPYDHVRAATVVLTRAQTSRTRERFFCFLAHLQPGPERERPWTVEPVIPVDRIRYRSLKR
ncbi:hypothetical protein GCM10018775_86460 [Streptomyces umbrinus]|nr:hypothetical protein GCM10018775_86460 [Streptomyces umbrinus]